MVENVKNDRNRTFRVGLNIRILPACATNRVSKPEACEATPAQPTKFIILQREVG